MAVPQRIPIARRDGQFYAAVHGAHRDDDDAPDQGREQIRWYAYLHLFDADGHQCKSEISLIAVAPYLTGEVGEQVTARLAWLLGQLEEAESGDIAICPFTLTHDGVTFGLIDESDPDRGSWAELYPDRLGFSDPGMAPTAHDASQLPHLLTTQRRTE